MTEPRTAAGKRMHPAELPIGAINAAIRGHLYGLWVQTTNDGTLPYGAGPVRVSVQYGWQGARLAEHGDGNTTAEAAADLLASLTEQPHD